MNSKIQQIQEFYLKSWVEAKKKHVLGEVVEVGWRNKDEEMKLRKKMRESGLMLEGRNLWGEDWK